MLSRDVDSEWLDAVISGAIRQPGPDGSLHERSERESLESWTYRELCGLHALANLALRRRNRQWALRVQTIALYHMAQTQPDHVTAQPWALFAFCWSEVTRPWADQQLHDAMTAGSGQVSPLAGLLLADAGDALGQFEV